MPTKHKLDRLFSKKVKSRLELYVLVLNLTVLVFTVLGLVSR